MRTLETKVITVDTVNETKVQVVKFLSEGYSEDNIYVLAYDKDRTNRVAEETNAEKIGIAEEGFGIAIANIFRSRGEQLRAKLKSMGFSESKTEQLETSLEEDKIVVIAWGGTQYDGDNYDSLIHYYPPGMY
ncbi:MAG: general stress protein [Bacillus sp. (in: Bacteria)]|nr:general stress protein [Bacillus sp. (in: firmicutes)]